MHPEIGFYAIFRFTGVSADGTIHRGNFTEIGVFNLENFLVQFAILKRKKKWV